MARILVVDDEKNIVKGIKFSLEQDGMMVDMAHDGEEALSMARTKPYDLIILDVMLPKIEGTDVCRQIREFSAVPVVMVTAKGDDMDKIMGLEFGADDYITKPFNILELKARIKAILRRAARETAAVRPKEIRIREVVLNMAERRVYVMDSEIYLTAREYDLLELLMTNAGKVYTREALLSQLWGGAENAGDVRTVDVHVRRLREKIEENPSEPSYLYTKWGVGYYFR